MRLNVRLQVKLDKRKWNRIDLYNGLLEIPLRSRDDIFCRSLNNTTNQTNKQNKVMKQGTVKEWERN